MLLGREINGFGFALSCDFLKELGYEDFPKPDVHLRDIFTFGNLYFTYKVRPSCLNALNITIGTLRTIKIACVIFRLK